MLSAARSGHGTWSTARRGVQVSISLAALTGYVILSLVRRGRWKERVAVRIATTLERLGGAFLKGGQFLSTRRDLVGPQLGDALGRLQDNVRPMRTEDALRVVAVQGIDHAQEVRDGVLVGAVASGSIACVYRVRLPHRDVAVKVRRPDAVRQITADTRIIRTMARALSFVPVVRKIPVAEIAEQLCQCVLEQLDFGREREHQMRFRTITAGMAAVTVPQPVAGMCGDQVLTMDFVEGLDRIANTTAPQTHRTAAVGTLVRTMYESLFLHGFVHVDLHQGNAYFFDDGEVVVIDFGFVYQLSEFARAKFTGFFAGMIDGDGAGCADTLLSTARAVSPGADLVGFRRDVADLVVSNRGRAVRDFSLPRFAGSLFDLQRRYGIYADPEFTFPLLSLLALDGTVREHDPTMDFQLEAAPFVMTSLLGLDEPG